MEIPRPFELPSLLNEQTTCMWDANLVTQRAGEERKRVWIFYIQSSFRRFLINLICELTRNKSKKDSHHSAVFLGEGIFTMGLVKTIYNVLGGFYMDYNSTNPIISVHKLNKTSHGFLCTFHLSFLFFPFSIKICIKKPGFLHLVLLSRMSKQSREPFRLSLIFKECFKLFSWNFFLF